MSDLSEYDYGQLLDDLIKKLAAVPADDIVRQIKELEKASIIEKAAPFDLEPDPFSYQSAAKKPGAASSQLQQIGNLFEYPTQQSPGHKPRSSGKKYSKDSVSEYRSRRMTRKEIFFASIDILEAYLITVPNVLEAVRTELNLLPSQYIMWGNELPYHDEDSFIGTAEFTNQSNSEAMSQAKTLINDLKDILMEESL